MKKARALKPFLDELRKHGNVGMASTKSGVARNTIYRWKKEDPNFSRVMDEALSEGTDSLSDFTQGKLISKVQEGNLSAIMYQLSRRDPRYMKEKVIELKTEKRIVESEEESKKELANLAESNIRASLQNGDKEMSKWVAEVIMPEKYSRGAASRHEESFQKEKNQETFNKLLQTEVKLKPGSVLEQIASQKKEEKSESSGNNSGSPQILN